MPVSASTLREYQEMVRLKTGALLATGCKIGALLAGQDGQVQEAARVFGEALGVAFQFQDDYLGIWGDAQVAGKTANDLQQRKPTLPVVLGIEQDPNLAELLVLPEGRYDPQDILARIEAMGVRQATEQQVGFAGERVARALSQLDLDPGDLSQFEDLVGFVTTRRA
jgi:geranylgeranyl diphosphate synthase type I